MLKGFMDFVREQGVVGMAVGLAIGAEAGKAAASLVEGFVSPIIGFVLGGTALGDLSWVAAERTVDGEVKELEILWGSVLEAVIILLAVAFLIYMVVKKLGLDKLDKK